MDGHTPTPWHLERKRPGYYVKAGAFYVALMNADKFDAEHIVESVNLRAELVELLRECVPYVQRGRFGNPPADELLARLYAVLGEPGADVAKD